MLLFTCILARYVRYLWESVKLEILIMAWWMVCHHAIKAVKMEWRTVFGYGPVTPNQVMKVQLSKGTRLSLAWLLICHFLCPAHPQSTRAKNECQKHVKKGPKCAAWLDMLDRT